jgi:hypothetical protein
MGHKGLKWGWAVVPGACIATAGLLKTEPATAYTVGKECIENFSACSGVSNLDQACDLTDQAGTFGGTQSFYWKNPDVWESDFVDQALGGSDHIWADNVDVFLFSGHGTSGGTDNWLGLRMPFTPGAPCGFAESGAGADAEMRFNREAELVFLDASCSGVFAERFNVWYGSDSSGMLVRAKQGFAFMNSPEDNDQRFFKFMWFVGTGMNNVDAWMEAGSGCIVGFFCDDESPISFTKGNTETDVHSRAVNMTMGNFQTFSAPTGGWFDWTRVNNGGC